MKNNKSLLFTALLLFATPAMAGTLVKGHKRYDADNNGYPDAGVEVNGHYTSLYAYDANGDWYWDLGDGRYQGSVGYPEELDSDTVTYCHYVNNYRADFGNDPYMNSGWITNSINCKGAEKSHYLYLIVHETDPRYTGNPDFSIWGNWEYKVLTESGSGNLVRVMSGPENPGKR